VHNQSSFILDNGDDWAPFYISKPSTQHIPIICRHIQKFSSVKRPSTSQQQAQPWHRGSFGLGDIYIYPSFQETPPSRQRRTNLHKSLVTSSWRRRTLAMSTSPSPFSTLIKPAIFSITNFFLSAFCACTKRVAKICGRVRQTSLAVCVTKSLEQTNLHGAWRATI